MLLKEICRGFISSSDSGINTSYYLYTGFWYRTLSPYYLNSILKPDIIRLNDGAYLYGHYIDDNTGGVLLVLELCY